jgi:hypothetical protein
LFRQFFDSAEPQIKALNFSLLRIINKYPNLMNITKLFAHSNTQPTNESIDNFSLNQNEKNPNITVTTEQPAK